MKRVLVTGASGFIGRHCLPLLTDANFEVHAVTFHSDPPANFRDIAWHRADLLAPGQSSELLARIKPSHLLHLAWYTVPGQYWASTENLRWLSASVDLFRAFAEVGGRRLVAAGSCAEYEWGRDEICSERATLLEPDTLYGACKHALSLVLDRYAHVNDLSYAWGRIFFAYGPHEPENRLVASVIRALARGEAAQCSHGEQVRDFLYVEDVANAFVSILDSDVTGAINIASGVGLKLIDVLNEIGEQLNGCALLRLNAKPSPANEPARLVADVDRLTREVGWHPRHSLAEGIHKTIEWWRAQGVSPTLS